MSVWENIQKLGGSRNSCNPAVADNIKSIRTDSLFPVMYNHFGMCKPQKSINYHFPLPFDDPPFAVEVPFMPPPPPAPLFS